MRHLFVLLIMVPFFFGCTVARMGVNGKGTLLGLGGPVVPPGPIGTNKAVEDFNSGPSQRKVDILFVDDNSASMDSLQTTMGSKFPAFSAALNGLDWQIGITTTDCSNGPYGICGSLVDLTGTQKILTTATGNYDQVFDNSIVRPETVGCIARGDCPSGISEPLKAMMNAMDKRSTNNAGFFRTGASLAVVILTNADEANDGPATATQPQTVVNHFNGIWGTTKSFKVYAVDVNPGDQGCLTSASQSTVGQVFFGKGPSGLAALTGGLSESICTQNWTPLLQQIGGDLQAAPNVISLQHIPTAGSVTVTLTPNVAVSWTVSGNQILFASALPVNTAISVEYTF